MKICCLRILCFLFVLGTVSSFQSCKRGDQDPFISFIPRDDRIKGQWNLSYYILDKIDDRTTTTNFNIAQCDTTDIGGVELIKEIQTAIYQDSLLNSEITNSIGNTGTTTIYDVKFSYKMSITVGGAYRSTGTYRYYDTDSEAQISGNFISEENSWYWEDNGTSKTAITFINFPEIDVKAITETGLPISFRPSRTFDLLKLTNDEFKLEYHNLEGTSMNQTFEPFTTSEVDNCAMSISTNTTIDVDTEWHFAKID